MTETIVPDTTPAPAELRMLIGAVVRTRSGHLNHQAGTKALVCSTREEGRFQLELLVPGFPIKFWVETKDVQILQAPDQDWWKLLVAKDQGE